MAEQTYDLTQTGAEVQAIINDANNMKGAGAQTTLTTEFVLLKDVNGQYHKILKSSFTEAIRDTLAGLLVNNDKGATINQIAAIASGDFGSVTPANLASVLGVLKVDVATLNTTDFNTVKDSGNYKAYFASQSAADAYHCPTYGALSIVVFYQSSFVTQLVYGSNGAYARNGSISGDSVSWASWSRLDNFGCNTPADLASLLGGESTSVAKNGGTTTVSTGVYAIGHPNYGYCLVSISESNNAGVFVEIGGVTLATLDVSIARTGTRTFTITNNNTDGTRLVKPILIMG